MKTLNKQIINCKQCPVHKTCIAPVIGNGPTKSPIMIITQNPNQEEDKIGIPFAGIAGKFLDKMLEASNINRDEVYVTNLMKCHTPKNRPPTRQEIENCISYLYRELDYVQPRAIITLGLLATTHLLNVPKDSTMSGLVGTECAFNGIPVFPNYHMSFLMSKSNKFIDASLNAFNLACNKIAGDE